MSMLEKRLLSEKRALMHSKNNLAQINFNSQNAKQLRKDVQGQIANSRKRIKELELKLQKEKGQ